MSLKTMLMRAQDKRDGISDEERMQMTRERDAARRKRYREKTQNKTVRVTVPGGRKPHNYDLRQTKTP